MLVCTNNFGCNSSTTFFKDPSSTSKTATAFLVTLGAFKKAPTIPCFILEPARLVIILLYFFDKTFVVKVLPFVPVTIITVYEAAKFLNRFLSSARATLPVKLLPPLVNLVKKYPTNFPAFLAIVDFIVITVSPYSLKLLEINYNTEYSKVLYFYKKGYNIIY